ncbi:hypothetical protein [Timonella sp. A28]|uniref:hypothetical protein n=1 Tax=Timonella sp. A28 TaxID=3442640 RepID=UPI003EB950EB
MSSSHPQGSQGRPATRRELRERAAHSGTQHTTPQQASPAQAPPSAASYGSQQQYRQPPSQPPNQPNYANPMPQRQVVEPPQQSANITRRSMYEPGPAVGVPNVVPPQQASAVRKLEETGTISNLVDPREFAQQTGHSRSAESAPQRTSGRPQASPQQPHNVSEFMRQAPASSPIPRIERDAQGNWAAIASASAQARIERAQEEAAMLPEWPSQRALQRDSFATQLNGTGTPFEPVSGQGRDLPNRSQAAAQQTQAAAFEPVTSAARPAAPSFDDIQGTQATSPVRQSWQNQGESQSSPPSFSPVSGDASSQSNADGQPRWDSIAGSGSAQQPNQPPSPFGRDGLHPSGLSNAIDDDDDEEEYELDHSYTWLHYIILIAVAFVLGMIIWKVALNPTTEAKPDASAASVTYSQTYSLL